MSETHQPVAARPRQDAEGLPVAALGLLDEVPIHLPVTSGGALRGRLPSLLSQAGLSAFNLRADSGIIHAMTSDRRPIRDRVLSGETLFGLFLDLDSPASAELAGRAGYDWLIVDLEHGATTEATLLAHIYAIETTEAAALVRPQSGERMRIGRALDVGAAGIMVPRLDSAAEAKEAVTFLRYPPDGIRGVATRTRGAGLGTRTHDQIRGVNDAILGIVQIESRGGLAEADAIAAIDGVDVLFVGPADLSHSLGIPGRFSDPSYEAALDAVVAACRAHGKAAGILLYDTAAVPAYLARGFTFVGIGADGAFVADTASRALAAVRD